jgi:signal transduction histidine kinase
MSAETARHFFMRAGRQRGGQLIVLALCLGAPLAPVEAQTAAEELHTAAAVRRLTVEQAERHMPVRIQGSVTFFDESLFSRFIQDDTAGIYLRESTNIPPLSPGQWVEVVGVTSPGEYAPVVIPEKVIVMGEAPLPEPKPTTFQQLAGGHEDSQFVQISGIVRSVRFEAASEYYLIEIATGGGRLLVYARQLPVESAAHLVDSTVRVRGVCSTLFNRRRQLFSIRLMVPRPNDLMIEIPAPAEPFVAATQPIDSLLQFTLQESYGHRVKVEGTVIYQEPGKELFLQDGSKGLQVQTREREPLQLGDRVEVLGFPSQGEYTPVLQDAIYRKLASGEAPVPMPVTHDAALTGLFDCLLVQIPAKLLDRAQHGADRYLILQAEDFIFQAYISHTNDPGSFAHLENGSRVSVTGVCRIVPGEWQAGEEWRAKSFRILLRSVADVVVIQAPPWWTFKKVLWIAGLLGVVMMTAFGWVVVLRRQVAERTNQLEAQIQERQRAERQQLIEQERTRVAQDLHDELGSTLTEVNILSSLAGTSMLPAERRDRYLNQIAHVSRSLVATLDEIVWAVNPRYDSAGSVASYHSLFAQRLLNLSGIACRLQVADPFPDIPLDSRQRHGVFLAFKEALNNAIRHSGASEVRITMDVIDGQLNIAVADNGKGFDSTTGLPGSDGLSNMQQRMKNLGGSCQIDSKDGTGTTVRFRLPLAEKRS